MRVALWPADTNGCGAYRLIWPGWALQDEGRDVVVLHPTSDIPALARDGKFESVPYDTVVVQRPLARQRLTTIRDLQSVGCAAIVEIDDDFTSINARNSAWQAAHPRLSPDENWDILAEACRIADHVVVTTPALARRYGSHGRVSIVPNCVPASYLDIERSPQEGTWVGWAGSVETHPNDLQETNGAVARALERAGAKMAVVGTGKGVRAALRLREAPFCTGWRPITEYPVGLAQFDVGIVPLERSAFNEAKSWLKGMEMAAVGVPFVASPTAPYRALHAEGAGVLAERPRDWEREVGRLLASESMREDVMLAGRQVAARWTIEANAWRWWEAWTSAALRRSAA